MKQELTFKFRCWRNQVTFNKSHWSKPVYFAQQNQLYRYLRIYNSLQLIMYVGTCKACHVLLPFLLLFGLALLVVCNYVTIMMHKSLPLIVYISMPGLSVFVSGIVMALFPKAADFYENSTTFLRLAKLTTLDKYWHKVLRSKTGIKIMFGSMFHAKRSTKTTFFCCVIDYTINLILTV